VKFYRKGWHDFNRLRGDRRGRGLREDSVCAWIVPPEIVRSFLGALRDDVQHLADEPLDAIPSPLHSHTAFVLVTLALRSNGDVGLKLLIRGFFEAYEGLASGNYLSESWQVLSPELPWLGYWRDWDRCQKLLQAAQGWLRKHFAPDGRPAGANSKGLDELLRKVFGSHDAPDHFVD
jgi:hypothetical protein